MYIITLDLVVNYVGHLFKTSANICVYRISIIYYTCRKFEFLSRSNQLLCYMIRIFQSNLMPYRKTDTIFKIREFVHFPYYCIRSGRMSVEMAC